MDRLTIGMMATAALLLAAAPLADAAETTIHALPERGDVTLFGTVERIKDEREFILRDNSGRVTVRLIQGDKTILDEGDSVTVNGAVDRSNNKDVNASSVEVHRRAAL